MKDEFAVPPLSCNISMHSLVSQESCRVKTEPVLSACHRYRYCHSMVIADASRSQGPDVLTVSKPDVKCACRPH